MKIQSIAAALFGLAFLAGCSDSSSTFKRDFIAGCTDTGGSKAFCACLVEKVDVQYSAAELAKMNDTGRLAQGFMPFVVAARKVCSVTTQ
jgi:hypothetical protein